MTSSPLPSTLMMAVCLACFLLGGVSVAGVPEAQTRIAAEANGGMVIVAEAGGTIILEQGGSAPFVPASVNKILTAWLALELLGPDHRFETSFWISAERDLHVRGGGDPYLISEELELLSPALLAAVGTEPFRDLVIDASYFSEGIRIPGVSDTDQPYDALNSALAVNFNTIHAEMRDGEVVSSEPQTPMTPTAIAEFRARGPGDDGRISLTQDPSVSLRYAGEMIATFLSAAGGSVSGQIREGRSPSDRPADHTHRQSRPLSEILTGMLRYSNNYIANQVFLELGARRLGGPASLEQSQAAIAPLLERHGLSQGLIVEEGSGISRNNRFSPQALIQLLDLFEPNSGLLHGRRGAPHKTGTMRGLRTIAGYADTTAHGRVRFVIGLAGNQGATRYRIIRILEEEL